MLRPEVVVDRDAGIVAADAAETVGLPRPVVAPGPRASVVVRIPRLTLFETEEKRRHALDWEA